MKRGYRMFIEALDHHRARLGDPVDPVLYYTVTLKGRRRSWAVKLDIDAQQAKAMGDDGIAIERVVEEREANVQPRKP